MQDQKSDRRALEDWIGFEIDQCLEELRYLKGVKFPPASIQDPGYRRFFDETVASVYKAIAGRDGN